MIGTRKIAPLMLTLQLGEVGAGAWWVGIWVIQSQESQQMPSHEPSQVPVSCPSRGARRTGDTYKTTVVLNRRTVPRCRATVQHLHTA